MQQLRCLLLGCLPRCPKDKYEYTPCLGDQNRQCRGKKSPLCWTKNLDPFLFSLPEQVLEKTPAFLHLSVFICRHIRAARSKDFQQHHLGKQTESQTGFLLPAASNTKHWTAHSHARTKERWEDPEWLLERPQTCLLEDWLKPIILSILCTFHWLHSTHVNKTAFLG